MAKVFYWVINIGKLAPMAASAWPPDDELSSFFVVTHFQADETHNWSNIQGWEKV